MYIGVQRGWAELKTYFSFFSVLITIIFLISSFIKSILETKYPGEKDKKTLTSQEMSEFYKQFMNDQWSKHLTYNIEWQKKNFKIIFLTGLVYFERIFNIR